MTIAALNQADRTASETVQADSAKPVARVVSQICDLEESQETVSISRIIIYKPPCKRLAQTQRKFREIHHD
jgi:hypothetical protein